jgi:hypothetical protein
MASQAQSVTSIDLKKCCASTTFLQEDFWTGIGSLPVGPQWMNEDTIGSYGKTVEHVGIQEDPQR